MLSAPADGPRRIMLTTDAVGGVWRYCIELARGFTALGGNVTIVAMGPPPGDTQREEAAALHGVTVVETGLPLDWLAAHESDLVVAARDLAGIARQLGAQTIQLHTPAFAAEAAWPAPLIAMTHSCVGTWWQAVHGHEPMPSDLAWRADAVARGLQAADAVIAPSRAFASALRSTYGTPRAIHAVPNGRRTTPLPRDPRPHVLTAGRLWDEAKNVAALDAAAALSGAPVLAAGPVAGPNGTRIDCRHLRLLGTLDDVALTHEYASAAVFASVARYEPFGLAVLEAAQAGAALILSDIPTFRELWNNVALFVDPDDVGGLADAIRRLLDDPTVCERAGEAARRRSARFSTQRMVDATWAVHCAQWQARGAANAVLAA